MTTVNGSLCIISSQKCHILKFDGLFIYLLVDEPDVIQHSDNFERLNVYLKLYF